MTSSPAEQEAAASFAQGCASIATVIRWSADRVRATDSAESVQDAADYLDGLAGTAHGDMSPGVARPEVIQWCARKVHSMGGDYGVVRSAEYLDDLATEAKQAEPQCPHCHGDGADPEDEGDWIPEAHQYNPNSRGPCPQCNGRGSVAQSLEVR